MKVDRSELDNENELWLIKQVIKQIDMNTQSLLYLLIGSEAMSDHEE